MSQTAVNEQGAAFPGMLYDISVKSVLSYAAEERIPFGRFVSVGTDPEKEVLLPSVATDITSVAARRGVALQVHTQENAQDGLDAGYPIAKTVSVMTKGRVWVEVEADVTPSSEVWVRHTADASLDQLGIFAPATGTGLAQMVGNAKWLTSSVTVDGKKLAVLEIVA